MNKNIVSKTLTFLTCWLLIITIMATSCITVFATEIDANISTEENIEVNVYDAESLKSYLQVENASIVLWQDITIAESVEALCNSIDLNGYNLILATVSIKSDGKIFSVYDSCYNTSEQSSTGKLEINNGLNIGDSTLIIKNGIINVFEGIKGNGNIEIYDGSITVHGKNGSNGSDGTNGKHGDSTSDNGGYAPTAGTAGENGFDGDSGSHGIQASNLYVYGGEVTVVGGNGGDGGNGGYGGRGGSDEESNTCANYWGGNGGNGGNGGDGGKSGIGIVVTGDIVFYSGSLSVKGGAGGSGGNGGAGGSGGKGDYKVSSNGNFLGGRGGNGGNGGNGGSNSYGGEGILATNFIVYDGHIVVNGGFGGDAGVGGWAGWHGNGGTGAGTDGVEGRNGSFYGNGGSGINANVKIHGGQVVATGGNGAAGIGGSGYSEEIGGHTVSILGGSLAVTGGEGAFDIGGGYDGTKVGAGGSLTVTSGTVEFCGTTGRATNVSNPTYKNCTITGEGAYNHEGTYNENGKFSISVTDITINPADCVGYDSVTLTASLKISRSTNITTPAPKGYISFKIDGLEIGTAKIANAVASEGVITATATMNWIAVEGEKTITAEYVSGINDQYASSGVFNYSSNITEHSHSWDSEFTVDVEPTCISKGSKSIHCSICHEKKFVEEIPVSDHTYINNKCSVCEGYKPLVVFKNYDETILSSAYYNLGDTVVAPSNPTRPEDETYTYSFVGWNNDVVECNGDAEYIAVYDSIYKNYTITFNNYDGSELSKTTYHFGQKVTTPSIPTKPADALYFYTFAGWDKDVVNCAGDATYTAMFNSVPLSYLPTIKVESYEVMAGETFTVEVMIENNLGFCYLELKPIFASELTLVDVENGTLISDFTKGNQYLWIADEDITADGLLLKLTFSVAEDLAEGDYAIDFTVNLCGNYNEENVPVTVQSGTITVVDFVYGDATGDGEVNGFDIIRLKKFLANYDEATGASTVEISKGADATGDGEINGFDIIRLKKYLANYDEETGTSTVALGPAN